MNKDVSKRRAKVYDKYVVQRSVGGRSVEKNEDGTPVLGKCVKTNIVITEETAETLNHAWDSSEKALSFYFKESKSDEKDEKEILLEEAKGLGIDVDGRTGIEKLKQLINEAK